MRGYLLLILILLCAFLPFSTRPPFFQFLIYSKRLKIIDRSIAHSNATTAILNLWFRSAICSGSPDVLNSDVVSPYCLSPFQRRDNSTYDIAFSCTNGVRTFVYYDKRIPTDSHNGFPQWIPTDSHRFPQWIPTNALLTVLF